MDDKVALLQGLINQKDALEADIEEHMKLLMGPGGCAKGSVVVKDMTPATSSPSPLHSLSSSLALPTCS